MKGIVGISKLALIVIIWSLSLAAFAGTKAHITSVEWVGFVERPEKGISKDDATRLVLKTLESHQNNLSEDELLAIADQVTIYFREKGYKFTTAYLPEQNLSAGVLKIAILDGKLGDIQFPGKQSHSAAKSVHRYFSDLLNRPVFEPEFSRRLDQINKDARIDLFGYYSRGSKPGETRVNFKVKEYDRWQFHTGIDNYGSPVTGNNRLNVKAALFSPLDRLDTLSIGLLASQGETSTEASTYGFIFYETPLWNLFNQLSFYVGNNLFDIGGDFSTLELEGSSNVGVIEYHYQWGGKGWHQRLGLAAQYIKTDYQSVLNAVEIEPDEEEVAARVSWQLGAQSSTGLSLLSIQMAYVGGQYKGNQFSDNREIGKFELAISAQTLFAAQKRYANHWRFSISGHYSEDELPDAEKRGLSGISGVRAIEAGYFSGDRLVVAAIEWRFPGIFGKTEGWLLQPLVFIDGAYGEQVSDETVSDRAHATGYGGGFELLVSKQFYARILAMELVDAYSKSGSDPNEMSVLAQAGVSF